MTIPHVGPPVDAQTIDDAEAHLRERGMRVSTARRLLLETLFAAERPLSAEQIAAGLDGRLPRSDLASVYRNLEALEQVGLVRHFHLGHGPGLYALASRQTQELLVCERCDAVLAVDPGELDPVRERIRADFDFEARFVHFPIVGLCARCASAPAEAGEADR
jgi:Fur family transcriptional regulator, ferric uptake regulator